MTKRRWNELVRLGREALVQESNAKWTIGDIVLEIEPIAGRTGIRIDGTAGVHDRLGAYAEELGVSLDFLLKLRSSANKWPAEHRNLDVAWTIHHVLDPEPGRVQMLAKLVAAKGTRLSVDDVLEARGLERRYGPGKVVALASTIGRTRFQRRRYLSTLTDAQIGEFIEDAWAVLEDRTREDKAA